MKPSVPIEDDEYTPLVTRLRIFDEGDGFALDGAGRRGEAVSAYVKSWAQGVRETEIA